jgi:hypothetical protein
MFRKGSTAARVRSQVAEHSNMQSPAGLCRRPELKTHDVPEGRMRGHPAPSLSSPFSARPLPLSVTTEGLTSEKPWVSRAARPSPGLRLPGAFISSVLRARTMLFQLRLGIPLASLPGPQLSTNPQALSSSKHRCVIVRTPSPSGFPNTYPFSKKARSPLFRERNREPGHGVVRRMLQSGDE